MDRKKLEIFLEFLIFGVVMGVVEDMIAVMLSTGQTITMNMLVIIVLVAIPFAAIGELIVDRIHIVPKKEGTSKK